MCCEIGGHEDGRRSVDIRFVSNSRLPGKS